ncbi:MAG: hypothetical protein CVU65_16075 [Deltaproteobacteria bacterium HGW-Deltaproteobacteria-22]|jgi:hypothetical protein|nr:MAG: hypothetical protein CVU65_16075 [Deltaproteobacteria bacterium HGW-Deltaproteobacteria-22]
MHLLWLLVTLLNTQTTEITRIEKAAAGKPVRILVPMISSYSNVNAGCDIHDAPNGKVLLQVPRGLSAHILETRQGWLRIAVLKPFVLEGWIPQKSAAFIINANTLFFASAKDAEARGLVNQGVIVFPGKVSGELTEVTVHHQTPIRVWVPTARIGVKFENNTNPNYRYNSRWNRYVFECSPGPLYAGKNSKVVVAELLEKAFFKKETEGADWIEISVVSDYDMRFKAWVPAKRMGTQSQYYYNYQYSFRVGQLLNDSWFVGGFQFSRPVSAQLRPDSSAYMIHLRAGTPISHIAREPNGLFAVSFGRRNYYYRPTLSTLLDALEGVNTSQYYVSSYDQMWIIKAWMPLTLMDVTISAVQ